MNEFIQHDLCRKDADHRHVVFHPDSLPVLKFLYEPRHGISIEDAVAAHLRRRQQIANVGGIARRKKRPPIRSSVRLFGPLPHRSRHERASRALQ